MSSRSLHRTNPVFLTALLIGSRARSRSASARRLSKTTARRARRASVPSLQRGARPGREARHLFRARPLADTDHGAQPGTFRGSTTNPGPVPQKLREPGANPPQRPARAGLSGEPLPEQHRGSVLHRPSWAGERARGEGAHRAAVRPLGGRDGRTRSSHRPSHSTPGRSTSRGPMSRPTRTNGSWRTRPRSAQPRTPKPAIVHFEITVESVRRRAATSSEQFDIAIVDASTGEVILDSRFAQRAGKPTSHNARDWRTPAPERPLGPAARPQVRVSCGFEEVAPGAFDADGRPAAYARVELGRLNQNKDRRRGIAQRAGRLVEEPRHIGDRHPARGTGPAGLCASRPCAPSQRELREAALSDSLTGMRNRRSLMADLEHRLDDATPERPLRWPCSTSTASRHTTTLSAIRPAMRCWPAWGAASRRRSEAAASPTGWAETNSASSPPWAPAGVSRCSSAASAALS